MVFQESFVGAEGRAGGFRGLGAVDDTDDDQGDPERRKPAAACKKADAADR